MAKLGYYQAETLYTPESYLRQPKKLLRDMGEDLWRSRELAWRLLIRDLSSQYRQSFLGVFWAFVPPIVTAVGLTLANNAQVLNIGQTDIPYPAYVIFSMTLWQTFAESVSGPIQAVDSAKPMLVRINFPREAIILSQLGQVGFNFLIKLILIIGLFSWFRIPVAWTVLLTPVALIHLICLGTCVGLFLAPIGALYQDISKGLTVALGLWFFLTPVIFPIPQIGSFATLVHLNPVTPLLVTIRELATTGILSNPVGFWIASGLAVGGLILGWLFYRLALPFAIERMSA